MFDVLIVGAGKSGRIPSISAWLILSRAFGLVRCKDFAGV